MAGQTVPLLGLQLPVYRGEGAVGEEPASLLVDLPPLTLFSELDLQGPPNSCSFTRGLSHSKQLCRAAWGPTAVVLLLICCPLLLPSASPSWMPSPHPGCQVKQTEQGFCPPPRDPCQPQPQRGSLWVPKNKVWLRQAEAPPRGTREREADVLNTYCAAGTYTSVDSFYSRILVTGKR